MEGTSAKAAPALLWACVARNSIILTEATTSRPTNNDMSLVAETAQRLLSKKNTPGWEFVTQRRRKATLKGMKFHIYDHSATDCHVWVVGAVYDPNTLQTFQVKSFVEKIVGITQVFRETDPQWKYGSYYAVQSSFEPSLRQRMEEIAYLGKMAMVNEEIGALRSIMENNIEMILKSEEKADRLREDATRLLEMSSVFRKRSKKLKKHMLWQNAKHGLLMGTVITGTVAVIVVPPIVAVL